MIPGLSRGSRVVHVGSLEFVCLFVCSSFGEVYCRTGIGRVIQFYVYVFSCEHVHTCTYLSGMWLLLEPIRKIQGGIQSIGKYRVFQFER